ncbi:MAG TPA: hypothetical protein VGF14_07700 [Alphaproteobacteria bacterium]
MNSQQAVWQHYHFAQAQLVDKKIRMNSASANPMQHRALYQRLQDMGRRAQRIPTLSQPTKWQPVLIKDDEKEGLGLSEL